MDYEKLSNHLYFSKEAAEFLGITVQRLNKLEKEGKIRPLKKNSSGTIFHVDELKRRQEELSIFKGIRQGGKGMFCIDTKTKQEALNYATLMNALNYTEHRLDPLFDEFNQMVPGDIPMVSDKICGKYAAFFNVGESVIKKAYDIAFRAFSELSPTDEIIKRGSLDYPPLLAQTEQAPRFLYIRGKKSLLYEKRTVALVGSRQASENAKANTRRLAEALGKNGITVISGLAKGIDVAAHEEALRCGYNTIAVIGTNLNQYYPAESKNVQLEIEKKGLVVSQFSPANKTERWFFPLRNGVMSGLSLATVIMEAGETSGALKQADFAFKQGRQIIIPENVLHIPKITWPQKYVKNGAAVVKSPMDVLKVLADGDIFKIKKKAEPVQQTLADYLEGTPKIIKKKLPDDAGTDWEQIMVIEG